MRRVGRAGLWFLQEEADVCLLQIQFLRLRRCCPRHPHECAVSLPAILLLRGKDEVFEKTRNGQTKKRRVETLRNPKSPLLMNSPFAPSPTCPLSFEPQPKTRPDSESARQWRLPHRTSEMEGSPKLPEADIGNCAKAESLNAENRALSLLRV